jgi:hypothetical protein
MRLNIWVLFSLCSDPRRAAILRDMSEKLVIAAALISSLIMLAGAWVTAPPDFRVLMVGSQLCQLSELLHPALLVAVG